MTPAYIIGLCWLFFTRAHMGRPRALAPALPRAHLLRQLVGKGEGTLEDVGGLSNIFAGSFQNVLKVTNINKNARETLNNYKI